MTDPTGGAPPPPPSQPPATPPPAPGAPAAGVAGTYAEWWKRVVARIIDGVILAIANAILSIPLGGLFAVSQPTFDPTTGEFSGGGGFFATYILANLLIFILNIIYFTAFHAVNNGQTPGKMAMKIAVRGEEDGAPPDWGKAAIRQIVEVVLAFLCFIPAIVDALFPLWDPKKQTIHDKAAKTVVVDVA
ncbi:MAG TPA: RDD family protein [Actinomycetota bacterium]|nr:RDD family protein [Actinomycetota bacterium]